MDLSVLMHPAPIVPRWEAEEALRIKETSGTKPLLFIDGDVINYRVTIAGEEAVDWGNDIWTLHSDSREAISRVIDCIEGLKETFEVKSDDDVIIAASCPDRNLNWRLSFLPDYKYNRKSKRKPLSYSDVMSYLKAHYTFLVIPTMEADDVLGILATHPNIPRGIMCSNDKDMNTIPGRYYNIVTEETVFNAVEDADRHHAYQALVGDAVDGYKGCPRIGKATAPKILSGVHGSELWIKVREAFRKAHCEGNQFLESAMVSRILRYGDYDFKAGEVRWRP